jgi:hypothetical protein
VNKAWGDDDFLGSQTSGAHAAQVTPIAHPPTVADHSHRYCRISPSPPLLSHQLHDALWPWLVPITVPRPRINREAFPFVRVNGSSELRRLLEIGWSGSKGDRHARAELVVIRFVLPLARKSHGMEMAIEGDGDGDPRAFSCSPPVASPLQSHHPPAFWAFGCAEPSSPVVLRFRSTVHRQHSTLHYLFVWEPVVCDRYSVAYHHTAFVWLCRVRFLLLGLLLSVSWESCRISACRLHAFIGDDSYEQKSEPSVGTLS